MLYEYATSLKSSEASGLLAFLSGWYLGIERVFLTSKMKCFNNLFVVGKGRS